MKTLIANPNRKNPVMTLLLCLLCTVILSAPALADDTSSASRQTSTPVLDSPTRATRTLATPRGQSSTRASNRSSANRPTAASRTSRSPRSSQPPSTSASPSNTLQPSTPSALPMVPPSLPAEGTVDDEVVQFKITSIHMELERSGRVLNAPRIATLQVSAPQIPLQESQWIGRKLGVYRQIFIPGQEEGTQVAIVDTSSPIGYLKVLSVYEMTVQAQVVSDDLNQLSRRASRSSFGPKVIRIGDLAQEVEPPPPPPKKKVIRRRKAKKINKLQRKVTKYRL